MDVDRFWLGVNGILFKVVSGGGARSEKTLRGHENDEEESILFIFSFLACCGTATPASAPSCHHACGSTSNRIPVRCVVEDQIRSQVCGYLMTAEIVSNGMSPTLVVGESTHCSLISIVPALILVVFLLGISILFTAKLFIAFKLNHPNVHTMGLSSVVPPANHVPTFITSAGDAGCIMFGSIDREMLLTETIIFSISAVVSIFLQPSLSHNPTLLRVPNC